MILMVSLLQCTEENYPSRTVEIMVQSAAGGEQTSRQEFWQKSKADARTGIHGENKAAERVW